MQRDSTEKKEYWIRRIASGFSVTWRIRKERRTGVVESDVIRSVNRDFLARTIDEHTARKLLHEFIRSLKPVRRNVFHSENAALLEKYWEEVYSVRSIRAPRSARNRLVRALSALGELSLQVADLHSIQKLIRDHPRQREIATVLNQLLRFIGRNIRIPKNRPKRPSIVHLTWPQLCEARKHIADERVQLLVTVLFCSGMRVGELFGLEGIGPTPKVYVSKQMLIDLSIGPTKTDEARWVPLILEGHQALQKGLAIPIGERRELRSLRSDVLRTACRKAGVPSASFKDLRHSFAIYLAEQGHNVGTIARCLGNSEAVCQRHYAGYVLTDSGIDAVLRSLS